MDKSFHPPECPFCDFAVVPGPGSVVRDPLLMTPDARLLALASASGIEVFDDLAGDGVGGAAAVVFDDDDTTHRLVWTANGLPDEVRADVLAFAIALIADPDDPVRFADDGRVGIGSERLAPACRGVGHLAWHLAAGCGHVSSSSTFEVFSLRD